MIDTDRQLSWDIEAYLKRRAREENEMENREYTIYYNNENNSGRCSGEIVSIRAIIKTLRKLGYEVDGPFLCENARHATSVYRKEGFLRRLFRKINAVMS